MKQLLEHITKSLADNPSAVIITETISNNTILLTLKVAPEDTGKIIGKNGRVAKCIRNILKSSSANKNKQVKLEIV